MSDQDIQKPCSKTKNRTSSPNPSGGGGDKKNSLSIPVVYFSGCSTRWFLLGVRSRSLARHSSIPDKKDPHVNRMSQHYLKDRGNSVSMLLTPYKQYDKPSYPHS